MATKAKLRPRNDAQMVDGSTWYYERGGSILVVHESRTKDGNYIQTDQLRIPWSQLMASAKRCGRKLP